MIKFSTVAVLIFTALATACGGSAAKDLTLADYETNQVPCSAESPPVGFDGCGVAVEISPQTSVATVCSCTTGGTFACFGHPGQPACAAQRAQQGETCGAETQCADGLECFGVCTFECGQKYSVDGSYGVDKPSVDRCSALGGACEQYAPGVQINVCSVPKG